MNDEGNSDSQSFGGTELSENVEIGTAEDLISFAKSVTDGSTGGICRTDSCSDRRYRLLRHRVGAYWNNGFE